MNWLSLQLRLQYWNKTAAWDNWASSCETATYHILEQLWLRQACRFVQSCQGLRYSSTQYMSHVIRKPFMLYANNKGADQPAHMRSAFAQSDQRLLLFATSSFYIWHVKSLSSFCDCAERFESTLVANPEDRFSCDEAHTGLVEASGKEPHLWPYWVTAHTRIWATTRQNVSSGVSDQARHKRACAATEAS